ncbi:hypothetical protein QQF64_019832, partial [Cirrhinus molitorella]
MSRASEVAQSGSSRTDSSSAASVRRGRDVEFGSSSAPSHSSVSSRYKRSLCFPEKTLHRAKTPLLRAKTQTETLKPKVKIDTNCFQEAHGKSGHRRSKLASTKPGVIDTREVSCFCGRNCQCFSTNCHVFSEEGDEDPDRTEATIEVGQWVLVEYDGDLFPGTVTQIAEGQYEVDTMTCAGENRFYVPSIRFPGERV